MMSLFHSRFSRGKGVLVVVLLCAAGGVLFFGHINLLLMRFLAEEGRSVEEHAALLEPFLDVRVPAGAVGRVPVVIVLPGCIHVSSHNSGWHDFFVGLGYAVVVVDSFTPRGFTGDDALISSVCSGRAVRGFDRAGDVFAAVSFVRRQPWADGERIVLAGWSHGGWAVMDALAFSFDGGLYSLPGVVGALLFYPYCGVLSAARSGFSVDSRIAVLQFAAGDDSLRGTERCLAWHASQDSPLAELVVYDGADHTFDIPPSHNRRPERFSPSLLEDAKRRVAVFLGEVGE